MSEREKDKLHIRTNWKKLIEEKKLGETLTNYFKKYDDGIRIDVVDTKPVDVNSIFDGGLPLPNNS